MKRKTLTIAAIALCVLVSACTQSQSVSYPVTKKVDQVDDYFGTKVADPYRWLENDNSEETKQWVTDQNKVTFAYLEKIPFRLKIKQRLTEIYNYPRYSSPTRAGEYYFFSKNDGLQNQSVLYVQKGLDGEPEVFIDPNALSPDGTIRVSLAGFSQDKKYVAINKSEAGSDWSELGVMEIATKKDVGDRIKWVKFSGAAWLGDGFFYSGYDKPATGQELTAKNEFQKIFFHKLGDTQDKDTLIYEDKEHPLRYKNFDVSEDGKYGFLTISEGTSGDELYCKDLSRKDSPFILLSKGFETECRIIDNVGDTFLADTNIDAPNRRVVLIDSKNPSPENWKTVIPEMTDVLRSANTGGRQLFCSYLKDANTKVFQYNLDGTLVREIGLPALGSAGGFGGWQDDTLLFYTFASFTFPSTIYKYDIASGTSEVFRKPEIKFNPGDYETKQVFYESKDKTKVPMFIVHKKGLALDGKNPAYLTGYGGFNISETPSFNQSNIILLENGGIFAQPNLRGGGEYGEAWHKAGMLLNKQNVFYDFIAAAEYLIREKYTSPRYLAIAGGSNGGLLVGAAMTQRPDLFKVALPGVGVMDMLRYHKFTVGWGWVVEYGSSEDEINFKNLYSYSPLHNLKDGVAYPATLVTTADHDDRVVPAHSFKFAAALQEKHKGKNPVLLRVETRSGHGASSLTKAIDLSTDRWAFMFYNMGITPKY